MRKESMKGGVQNKDIWSIYQKHKRQAVHTRLEKTHARERGRRQEGERGQGPMRWRISLEGEQREAWPGVKKESRGVGTNLLIDMKMRKGEGTPYEIGLESGTDLRRAVQRGRASGNEYIRNKNRIIITDITEGKEAASRMGKCSVPDASEETRHRSSTRERPWQWNGRKGGKLALVKLFTTGEKGGAAGKEKRMTTIRATRKEAFGNLGAI